VITARALAEADPFSVKAKRTMGNAQSSRDNKQGHSSNKEAAEDCDGGATVVAVEHRWRYGSSLLATP
jgi:hypothetical protein